MSTQPGLQYPPSVTSWDGVNSALRNVYDNLFSLLNKSKQLSSTQELAKAKDTAKYSKVKRIYANIHLDSMFLVVLADANDNALTVTLPAPNLVRDRQYTIKKIDGSANAVTVDGGGSNVDGIGTRDLTAQYESMTVVSDGTEWFRL